MEPHAYDSGSPDEGETPLAEVTHVPLWVKGLVLGALVLFALQLPAFPKSLRDSTTKHLASAYYRSGDYRQAIDGFEELHASYPDNIDFTKSLAFSYYRSGAYSEALVVFGELADETFMAADAKEINAAIDDIIDRLGLKTD